MKTPISSNGPFRTSLQVFNNLMAVLCLVSLGGCAALLGSVTKDFGNSLATAILENDDLEMVRDGAPSFLILMDSLVANSPDDAYMLQQSAKLHTAYAAAFVEDEARAQRLHAKAKRQALGAVCLSTKDGCDLDRRPFDEYTAWVEGRSVKEVPVLYDLGITWTGWIRANSGDFNAVAELARAKALMHKVEQLDPGYDNGGVYLYLGAYETLVPAAAGGKPEQGRAYFEEAVSRSEGRNLMAKVLYAEQYARLVFDRELHDQLLHEVMQSSADAPGMTLMNTLAKDQAKALLESADDYF